MPVVDDSGADDDDTMTRNLVTTTLTGRIKADLSVTSSSSGKSRVYPLELAINKVDYEYKYEYQTEADDIIDGSDDDEDPPADDESDGDGTSFVDPSQTEQDNSVDSTTDNPGRGSDVRNEEVQDHVIVVDLDEDGEGSEEEAGFDIFEFMRKQGQKDQNKSQVLVGLDEDTPSSIVQYKMEDFYAIPRL